MKTLKKLINEVNGLRFIYENLKLNSGIGRKYLLESRFIAEEFILKVELENLSEVIDFIKDEKRSGIISKICDFLHQLNDIHSTLNNLAAGRTLDDIELFEIKKFGILSQKIKEELNVHDFNTILLNDLNDVIDILDPERTRIPSFYIYSAYDIKLAELRKLQKNTAITDPEEAERLRLKSIDIEDEIRYKLSLKLSKFSFELSKNLDNLACLDVLIAKALQSLELGLCKPVISHEVVEYKGIFNPLVKDILNAQSKKFQAVDIRLSNAPCLITGANMSGKTVLLKTIALSQYMFQFGFYVPAEFAEIMIFDDIMSSIGDNQSEINGLSSFAIEMKNINNIIISVKKGKKILALVDELARTTNPEEGKAIVSAFLDIMSEYKVCSLVTTHYGGIIADVRRLRVKGLTDVEDNIRINAENINDYMDYSLIEIYDDTVPAEALKIIEILEIDRSFIEKTKKYLGK